MRQVLTILLLCLTVCQATAQRISRTYQNQSLSEVLKDLNDASSRYEVSFIYNELEDFRVTATLHRSTLPNAVRQVVGFYPMRVTETDNVITVECIHKTDLHLSGTIIDEQGQPIAYANIAILNPADSTLLCGGVSNESGVFVIPIDQPNILARISYVGYKTIYKQCNSTEVGMIWMRPETQRCACYEHKGYYLGGNRYCKRCVGASPWYCCRSRRNLGIWERYTNHLYKWETNEKLEYVRPTAILKDKEG